MPNLYDEVIAASTFRETKAEIVEYYQAEYPHTGKGGWKQNLIADYLDRLYDVNTGTVGKEEYKRQVKNLSKRFDPQRLNNPEPRNAADYKALGETLPPIPPENGYHIYGVIWFKYMDEPCEDREVDEDITGEQAQELANMAYENMLQAVLNHYMTNDGKTGNIHIKEPMLVTSAECAESDLHVEPIE